MSPTNTNEWKEKETLLGSGGFGNIRLFLNKDGSYLVVKECKQKNMTARMKERWQNECDIMLKIHSPYIVKSVPLPEELRGFNILSNPVLPMEYCNSGDLRKELNHPHNMFGLEEIQVKAIVHDISSAIKYLHTLRIYHRDLKPENIVLHKSQGRRVVYKIIDLGYAKEVSQDSICTSFVGTIQYLAPELLSNTKPEHTGTVDYWSLGTTIFECISGFRPFMQFTDMFNWLQVVRSKSDKDIYAYSNNVGSTLYSDRLPRNNKISCTSQTYFEAWLRQMLMYDPKRRGGLNENKIPACYNLLDTLFQQKPLHVFDPLANESHFFDIINNESLKSIGDLSLVFCRILNVPPGDHFVFMTTTGLVAEKDSCLTKYRSSVDYDQDQELEEIDIDLILACPVIEIPEKKKSRGMKLDQLMTARQNAYDSTDQLKLSKNLTHYCWTLYRSFQHRLKSFEGIKLCLLRERTHFEELVETLRKAVTAMQSKVELFSESLMVDVEEAKQQPSGVALGLLLRQCLSQNENITHWKNLIVRGETFADKYNAVECKAHECLKRLCPENEREVTIKSHFQTAQEIVDYTRNTTIKQADKVAEIIHCLLSAENDFEQFSKESRSHMRTIIGLCKELLSFKAPIEEIIRNMDSASHEITSTQMNRQRQVWRIIDSKKTQVITGSPTDVITDSPTDVSKDLSAQELYLKSMDLVNRAKVLLSENTPPLSNDLSYLGI